MLAKFSLAVILYTQYNYFKIKIDFLYKTNWLHSMQHLLTL
jgi:hypothetical protein